MTARFARTRFRTSFACLIALTISLVLAQAGTVLGHGGFHERMEYLTTALEKTPSDPVMRFELAALHAQHGDTALALKNLDKVDAVVPGKFPTDLIRGEAYFVAHDYGKAKLALDRQLTSHPETARAWVLRARAEQELGQQAASLADYREALKRTTSPEPDLFQELADALIAADKKSEADEVLAAGIEKLGKIPSLVLRAVDLEVDMKNFDAALRRIDQAQQDAPRPEPWMARRAAVLAKAGRIEESRAAWKALLDRLDSLPDNERASRAMSQLRDEARTALH
jgi:predicted Zn-dependent protease